MKQHCNPHYGRMGLHQSMNLRVSVAPAVQSLGKVPLLTPFSGEAIFIVDNNLSNKDLRALFCPLER